MVNVRPLRTTDRSEWLRLRRSLWPDHAVEDLTQEMEVIGAAQHREPVFVAERPDGGLCGFVEVTIHTRAPGCASERIGYLEAW